VQAGLDLCWSQTDYVGFCHGAAQMSVNTTCGALVKTYNCESDSYCLFKDILEQRNLCFLAPEL
jgi:hypothetical protein